MFALFLVEKVSLLRKRFFIGNPFLLVNLLKESFCCINMIFTHILIRAGELFLKGKNAPMFEHKLVDNAKKITGVSSIMRLRGRFLSHYFENHHSLTKVFGIVSYSPAVRVEKNLDDIQTKALELLSGLNGTFKIEPKRSDKRFPLTSPEINIVMGKYIEEHTSLKFDGLHPDHLLGVEINQEGAYLFLEIIPCFGGLPTGVEGRVMVLLENEASILAGLLLMKRGCDIVPVAFSLFDISLLQQYSPRKLELSLIQSLDEISARGMEVVVSGQCFDDYKKYDTHLTVLRPLIHYNEEEVRKQLDGFRRG